MPAPQRSIGTDVRAELHQLCQPLTAILSNAQAAKRFLAGEPPNLAEARSALSDIIEQSKHETSIFRRVEDRLDQPGPLSGG